MINPALKSAYRWNRQTRATATASEAIERARLDVAANRTRYPSNGFTRASWQPVDESLPLYRRYSERLAYIDNPAALGLREVGRVVSDCGGRNGIWDTNDCCGWFTDAYGDVFKDGTGLCYGVVYQIPGKSGKARFVAGFQHGGTDAGPTLDLATVYEESTLPQLCTYQGYNRERFTAWSSYEDNPREMDAAKDAARAADSMAEKAAEEEREYQTAWQLGRIYDAAGEDIEQARGDALELLKERRAARGNGDSYPSICAAIREQVESLMDTIREARATREKALRGDSDNGLCVYMSARNQSAFCDAAELDSFPA